MSSNSQSETTHVRANKPDVRRIERLGKKLRAERRGKWTQPEVIGVALDALSEKLGTKPAEAPTA